MSTYYPLDTLDVTSSSLLGIMEISSINSIKELRVLPEIPPKALGKCRRGLILGNCLSLAPLELQEDSNPHSNCVIRQVALCASNVNRSDIKTVYEH